MRPPAVFARRPSSPVPLPGLPMGLPIRHLPVLQNWDCHVCGTCCQEYQGSVTDEERRRIEEQGGAADRAPGGPPPFPPPGPPWARRYRLNHREDGSCVFLGPEGRCRIHERFGYEAKPLPCRLFPFVLVPAGDHWRVGLRYACPSAAADKGRALPEHQKELEEFAAGLAAREKLKPQPDGSIIKPPRVEGARLDWPDVLRLVDALLATLRNKGDAMERRL